MKKSKIMLDEPEKFSYNNLNIDSHAVKGRVSPRIPFREPRLVERGTDTKPNMVPELRRRQVVCDGCARYRAGVCWYSVRPLL